jgi:hypothetical protein
MAGSTIKGGSVSRIDGYLDEMFQGSRVASRAHGGLICVLLRAFSAPVEDAHRLDASHSERYTHSSHVDRQ